MWIPKFISCPRFSEPSKSRVLKSIIVFFIGLLLISASILSKANIWNDLIKGLGFSTTVAGIVFIFHEVAIRKTENSELVSILTKNIVSKGIIKVADVRLGYDRYLNWLLKEPQTILFAGRTVLTRQDADIRGRNRGTVIKHIIEKFEMGSQIVILTFDPRSKLIEQIAKDEKQSMKDIYRDFAITMAIVLQLYRKFNELKFQLNTQTGSIEIILFDNINHIAYHSVQDLQSKEPDIFIGFYLSNNLGYDTPVFEVLDPEIKKYFEDYMKSIYLLNRDENYILRFLRKHEKPDIKTDDFLEIMNFLKTKIDEYNIKINDYSKCFIDFESLLEE